MNKTTFSPSLVFVFLIIILSLAMGCSTTQKAKVSVPDGTVINEKEGPVFNPERRLISALSEKGIMVPDSVVTVQDTISHGYVRRIQAPNTIHLTTYREKYPSVEIVDHFPYLFGRTAQPKKKLYRAWIAAHEIAHIHGPRLDAEMGRPALGVDVRTEEVQAEILALVYMNVAYGVTYEDLGYPASVDYPVVPNKSTVALQRIYCHIVQETHDVQGMNCS